MTKEELRDIYFGFYEQLNEPERSEAKVNWDYEFCSVSSEPKFISEAISQGFSFEYLRHYWMNIIYKYKNKVNKPSFMTRETQELHFNNFIDTQKGVLFKKSKDYATDIDVLSNFKFAGSICGLTPEQNCLSLIATKVARLGVLLQGKIPNNESIQDSVLDLANYAVLLDMIISERGELDKMTIPIPSCIENYFSEKDSIR